MKTLRRYPIITIIALLVLGLVQTATPAPQPNQLKPSTFKVTLSQLDAFQATWDTAVEVDGKGNVYIIRLPSHAGLPTERTLHIDTRPPSMGDTDASPARSWWQLLTQYGPSIALSLVNVVMHTQKTRRRRQSRSW